jgi:hypothetical protein
MVLEQKLNDGTVSSLGHQVQIRRPQCMSLRSGHQISLKLLGRDIDGFGEYLQMYNFEAISIEQS